MSLAVQLHMCVCRYNKSIYIYQSIDEYGYIDIINSIYSWLEKVLSYASQ